jgi:calcineurin-like phosphoesterase family protein
MTQTWFTSDLHIRHDLVVIDRGFFHEDPRGQEFGLSVKEVAAHDAYEAQLADNWDSVVKPNDRVFVLGDIAMNPNKGAFAFLDARPGVKTLIAGNHDEVAGFHSKAHTAQRKWLEHFASIHDFLQIKVGGRRVALSHYPYSGEGDREMEDRMTQWRLRDEGLPLLHGHIHSHEKVTGPYSYHVGLDAHGMNLVPVETIEAWLETLP